MGLLKQIETPWEVGLLILRLGLGASMLILHGYGKISGGPAVWKGIGSNMDVIGIGFLPVFWGFMAAFSESVCALLIMIGVFFRPATALLVFTMLIAALRHLTLPDGTPGAGFAGASHALDLLIVYAGLFFLGPGKYVVTIRR